MPGEHFAEGTPASLQEQVHAPLIPDSRNRRLQGPEYLQAWNGQLLSERLQGLAGFPRGVGLGPVQRQSREGRIAQPFAEGQLRGGEAFEILGQGEGDGGVVGE